MSNNLKPGDKVRVERTDPIGPDGTGEGVVREVDASICVEVTIDFTTPHGVVDCYVKRDSKDDIWFQWGSRNSLWKITKLNL
jgi:hypothetical protein